MLRILTIAKHLVILLNALAPAILFADEPADASSGAPPRESKKADVVYVSTPNDVVMKMLDLAAVTKNDMVYDLGCGDGRIVVAAARRRGAHAVGFDIDPNRIKESRDNADRNKVQALATFQEKDIFTVELGTATVVTMYLLPELNVKLIPQLDRLPPGARIVSHDFDMKGVTPDKVVKMVSKEDNVGHTLFLWTTPLKKE